MSDTARRDVSAAAVRIMQAIGEVDRSFAYAAMATAIATDMLTNGVDEETINAELETFCDAIRHGISSARNDKPPVMQ